LTEYSHNLISIQLKKEYKEVKQIQELSGFGWDADKHVVTAADDVWYAYIEVCYVKKPLPSFNSLSFTGSPQAEEVVKDIFSTL
jgi:hypothetical protein